MYTGKCQSKHELPDEEADASAEWKVVVGAASSSVCTLAVRSPSRWAPALRSDHRAVYRRTAVAYRNGTLVCRTTVELLKH
jgi:hypothetical protein